MINKDNYEYWLVQLADGALPPEERAQVEAFLEARPEVKAEYELFLGAPRVEARKERFEEKESLKKSVVVPLRPWRRVAAAAACVALLAGVGLRLLTEDRRPACPQMAAVPAAPRTAPTPVAAATPGKMPGAPAQAGGLSSLEVAPEPLEPLEEPEIFEATEEPAEAPSPALRDDPAEYYALLAEMMLDLAPLPEPEETAPDTLATPLRLNQLLALRSPDDLDRLAERFPLGGDFYYLVGQLRFNPRGTLAGIFEFIAMN